MDAFCFFFPDNKNKQVCSLDDEYESGVGRVKSIQLICAVHVFRAISLF